MSSTLIFGDAGHSISPLDGDNAVDANECGETESRPEEYPQSEDEDIVLADVLPGKCDDVVATEGLYVALFL